MSCSVRSFRVRRSYQGPIVSRPSPSNLVEQRAHVVADAHFAALDHPRVDAAQLQRVASLRADETLGIAPISLCEQPASRMRLRAHLDLRTADREPRGGRQVLEAQIEIHIELIASERPSVAALREQLDEPCVDDGKLLRAMAFAERPTIADETLLDVEQT